ncbi:Peptide transporter PTR2 [Madurella mycetomatis]|uniref:Peptide transporter PTR2 n=1 Tax=Madurella mycetomatis TaxID=100816 RepID=A0A175WC26_9PEZI|nr:Peptide transporter PTR2 [Madurella mycetomatis]
MICWGVAVCGVAHVIMIVAALLPVFGHAMGPFALSLYMLAIGASQFKPNISPTVMDQNPHEVAHGEKAIVDSEQSLNGQPSGGSDLGNVFEVLGDCLRHGGSRSIGRKGFWEHGKPSVRAAAGSTKAHEYGDQFVEDPIFYINDGGLGAAANTLTAGMCTNGLLNNLLDNLNSVSIVIMVPIMNHVVYPFFRRRNIR